MMVEGREARLQKKEKLGTQAAVKGTMLQAHLEWAAANLGPDWAAHAALDAQATVYATRGVLATDWVPLASLVRIDRAIAAAAGGAPERTFHRLGHYSATRNLAGAYKGFVQEEPHRFFEQTAVLHSRFQNFGRFRYERTGDRRGLVRLDGYDEYSPVYCASGAGYYEGALATMGAPGPIAAVEKTCICKGDEACTFELAW